jgi:hypothetical protein
MDNNNPQNKGGRNNDQNRKGILIDNIMIIKEKTTDEGAEINVSFFLKKNDEPLIDYDYEILINRLPLDPLENNPSKTDKYGMGLKRFLVKSDEVTATIIVTDKDDKKQYARDRMQSIAKKKEKKEPSPVGKTTYPEMTTEISAKIIEILKVLDDFTADTDKYWQKIYSWLKTKSDYEKAWFLKALTQVDQNDKKKIGTFLEQFAFHEDKDTAAKEYCLLPLNDPTGLFNQRLNQLKNTDEPTYEKAVNFLSDITDGELLDNLRFNTSFLKDDEFLEIIKTVSISKDPYHSIRIRGLFNKK